MHGHFLDSESAVLYPRYQLDRDAAAGFRQGKALQHLAAHQAEVAVHVTRSEAEGQSHELAVGATQDLAIERVVPLDFPTLDNVNLRCEFGQQLYHFARVVLRIAIGIEDELLAGSREAALQRPAIAAVALVTHDPQIVAALLKLRQHRG